MPNGKTGQMDHRHKSRLRVDTIDLYQMHHFDPHTPLEETSETLKNLVSQGKIRYFGISNYTGDKIKSALDYMAPVSLQTNHNMLDPSELSFLCKQHRVSLLPYGVFKRGIISNKYLDPAILGKDHRVRANRSLKVKRDLTPAFLERIQNLKDYSRNRFSLDLQHLAIAWALKTPGVASLVLGIRNLTQLNENLNAF